MPLPFVLPGLTDREAITDALIRYIDGFDKNDLALTKSAMAEDYDFVMNGQSTESLDGVHAKIGPMDTTHTISNIRIDVKPDASTAKLTATAVANHCPPGRGSEPDGPKLLVGALCHLDLVKEGKDGLWKVKKFNLDVQWRQGDPSVMA